MNFSDCAIPAVLIDRGVKFGEVAMGGLGLFCDRPVKQDENRLKSNFP